MTSSAMRRVRSLVFAGGALLCFLQTGGLRGDSPQTAADWRFGRLELVDRGAKGIKLYASLHNAGEPSSEEVLLWVVGEAEAGPARGDKPLLDLSRLTRKRRASVVEDVIFLPPDIEKNSTNSYRIVLTVDDITTDFVPVVDGEPVLDAPERKRFHG